MFSLLAIFLALFPPLQSPPRGQLVDDLVDGVTRTYSKLTDFSASFEQILTDPSNQRQVERGLLYLARKDKKMRFDYQTPVRKSYYSDGKTYTAYVPATKQAVQTPVGKAVDDRLQIFQVLVGNAEWRRQYPVYKEQLQDAPVTAGNRVVRMFPTRKDLPEVLLEINPKTYLIHRFGMRYSDGENSEFRLSDLKTTKLDPAIFNFKVPPGVDLVRE